MPTLVLGGGKSADWFKHAARVVADHVGGDKHAAVAPGQDHNAAAKAIAPVLIEFFAPELSKTKTLAAA